MTVTHNAPDFLTEVNDSYGFPSRRFNQRERQVLCSVFDYISTPGTTSPVVPTLASTILGTFTNFSSLAGAGVTNTGSTVVTGDLGTSPTTSITGFPPGIITGTSYGGGSLAASAQVQLTSATAALNAMASTATVSGDIGSTTKLAGVYDSTSTLGITGALTLDAAGDPTAQFVFRLGTALTTAASSSIVLANGALADNVFFLCGSAATLGASSTFNGNIIAGTAISLGSAASVVGRLWAGSASITMISNTITPSAAGSSFAPSGNIYFGSVPVSLLSTGASQIQGRAVSSTFTVTIASPGVITGTANGLANGDEVVLSTTGALPTGLSVATAYYVVSQATDSFRLALTPGGAAIITSGSQSGVHTYSASGLRIRAASVTLGQLGAGIAPSHVVKYAANYTTAGGAAAEAVTVSGVLSTDIVIASMVSPQGAQTLLKTAATANTITFTFSADPSSSTIVAYQVLRAAV